LRRDLDLEGDDRRLLEVVYSESQRLGAMVTDFLKYARPTPPQKSPRALDEILDDLILLLTRDGRVSDRVRIKKSYEEGLPLVDADEAQIRDAVWNLLVNGVEAMPQGGLLHVSLRSQMDLDSSTVEIVIADTGAGIPEEDKEKLFQPFHTTKAEGTGLGLAIVQRVVEGHGGTIELESAPGQGSTFTVSLPMRSNE
jgi:two-component system sensor histidine kinase HydH